MKAKPTLKPIVVESGIDLPPPRNRFPFWDMKVGSSFLVACEPERAKGIRSSISTAVSGFRKRHAANTVFTTRIVDGGVRCWRVK